MSSGVALAGQVRVRVLTALILLAFIACGLCSRTCECDTPQVRAALIRFFYATGGFGWENASGWASYDPVCSWYGIRCQGANLTDIILNGNRLKGTLPAELANITSIQRLNLSLNGYLDGPVPPEWSAMTHLVELYLSRSSLNGTLPREWSKMPQIRVLHLDGNRINGSLPPEWSTMKQIRVLHLDDNHINGTLPPQWGTMTQLVELTLRNNYLNGTLPPQWSATPKLERLDVGGNDINGSLPPEWGKMRQIREIRLDGNKLSGPLPSEWSNMAQLEALSLEYNSLSGPLAPCLFPLWNASFMGDGVFDFSYNNFIGRLRLPCLSIDPCLDPYRKKLNDLVLNGNGVWNDWFKQCARMRNTAIESPNLAIVRVENSSQCCSACVKFPRCVAAVYHDGYYDCELKNVTSPTFAMQRAEVLLPP